MAVSEREISLAHARRFILRRQGLLGEKIYRGKQGVIDYTRRAGCVQFDPVDVCGRSPELSYFSRVAGYQSAMLSEALYADRALIDYFDKNLCILPAGDWPCFARTRAYHMQPERRSYLAVQRLAPAVRAFLREHGPAFSEDLPDLGRADWYWSETSAARAVLEMLYFRGELCVHHKENARRCFDFAQNCLPGALLSAPDPYPDDAAHRAFLLWRRIGAAGMLWNRRSDAHLCIPDFSAANRARAYAELLEQGLITPVRVSGLKDTFYLQSDDLPLLDEAQSAPCAPRTELIPPLDGLLWDRKQISALFGFDYRWEIYTPVEKRAYGHYVLPVLQGERFAARLEAVRDKKEGALVVRHVWVEDGVKPDKRALRAACRNLAAFNGMRRVIMPDRYEKAVKNA